MITNVLPRFYETVYFEHLLLINTRLLIIHAVIRPNCYSSNISQMLRPVMQNVSSHL